jgi:hypothetical protein
VLTVALIGLLAGAAAAAAGQECRTSRPLPPFQRDDNGVDHLEYRTDVDGDGREDVLRVEDSRGSGGGLTSAVLTLGTGETLAADFEYSYARIVAPSDVPTPLAEPRHRAARDLIEEALFHRICAAPDPSLEWLLRGDGDKALHWTPGPPVLPDTYVVRRAGADGEEWLWYGGHNHAYREGKGPVPPRELARLGQRVLLGTPHGVILTDPGHTRHAWVYVSTPEHKLRWPSVLGARLVGDTAVVRLSRGDGYLQDEGSRTVRIDLTTGAVR